MLRQRMVRMLKWRFEVRMKRTDPLRCLTDEAWIALYDAGVVIPDNLRYMTLTPDPTVLQRARFKLLSFMETK